MNELTYNTVDCPVKDLLYLIRQDEIEKLRSALLELIDTFQPGGEIYLYEQGYSLYETANRAFAPKLLASLNGNAQSNKIEIPSNNDTQSFNRFKFLPTDDYVQVFSVEGERSGRGLLITINKNIIDEDYISTLLNVYNNQVYLLRNKETDSLTGLYNRHSFDTKLAKLHENLSFENRSDDTQTTYQFALLDIDHFKLVNDEYGHVYGDEVLLLFSNALKDTFRDADMLFRFGGEEFVVLLKDVNSEQTESILNRFRKSIEMIPFPLKNKVTISIGFCSFSKEVPLTTVIERADKALYYSKDNGRNKVSHFESLREQGILKDTTIDEGDIELF